MKTKITRFAIACTTILSINCMGLQAESVDCTDLITNPNFEDGLNGWTVVENTFSIESWGIGADGGSKSVGMSGKVSPSISQSIIAENGNYTLSLMYTAKDFGEGTKPTISINGASLYSFFDGKAQTATVTFNVTEGIINLVISGQDLEKGKPYLNIDNLKLIRNTTAEPPIDEDINCTSLITNPNFEDGLNGWTVVENTFSIESWGIGADGGNKSVGMSGKANPSISQIFNVENGNYVLSFLYTAKDFGEGTKPVVLVNGKSLYTFNDGKSQTATLTFNVTEGHINIEIKGEELRTNDPYPYLNIDNFKLIKKTITTSAEKYYDEFAHVYFHNNTLNGIYLPVNSILNIYNIQGQIVHSEKILNETINSQLSLPQGIYFVIINDLKWKIKI